MTATTEDLEDRCGYVLGTDYSQGFFDRQLPAATAQAARDLPNADAAIQDEAATLRLGHLIFVRKHAKSGMSSESIGDYSYTRDRSLALGASPWLAQYEALLTANRPRPNAAAVRHDAALPAAFAMSDQSLGRFRRTDE